MRAAKKITVDRKLLQELVPLNALSPERFKEISEKIVIEEVLAGRYLFRKGDRDNQSIYLLEGKVNLIDGFRKVTGEVEAGTDISRYPIANQQPRSLSARAVKKVVIARVDSGLLDVFLTWDQSCTAEVVEIGAESNQDWMTRILQSEAFIKIPPSMIQNLLIKMETLPVKAGDVVIRQGDSGDYFYTLHEGRCAVTRHDSPAGEDQLLAELRDGDSFGEDALVSDAKRNATVTMLTDGLLMRLAKKDFVKLLKNQLVKRVDYEQAAAMVDDGAVWVDVRTQDEYEHGAFEDSVNIPLFCLRDELSELVFNSKYIICCDTGRRSESAGFLLSHKGFDVYVLEGGIPGLSNSTVEPVAQGEVLESPDNVAEVIDFDEGKHLSGRESGADSSEATSEKQLLQEQLSGASAEQATTAGSVQALQQDNETLRTELRDSSVLLEEQKEQLENLLADRQVAEEAVQRQQSEWDTERTALQESLDNDRQVVASLREELSQASVQASEDKSAFEGDLKAQLGKSNEKIERLELKQVELKQKRSSQNDELETLTSEHDQLQQQLADSAEQNKQLESELESLKQQAESLASTSDEQLQHLQAQLEEAQIKTVSVEQSGGEKDAQIESFQEQLEQQGAEHEARQQERNLLQQQLQDLQLQFEQQEERTKLLEQENEESVNKAHEELTRKNDNVKELQGQIDRLRKKLEQQTADHQKAREGAQDDLDNLREQLHTERQERADERAEMAARQRELKEQFSVIATEHETNLSNQSGAIEQARHAARQEEQERLREILVAHSESEDEVIKLQQELKKAHEEVAEFAREAKDRRQVDIELMEDQNQQAVATISQLELQLKQLVKDRDVALEDQQSLRNKMNALRGEVEVARGLMGVSGEVEDPAQLRKELDENKKNVEIALRLRAEAEAARDQLLLERDALQQQDTSEVSSEPLHVPSLDEGAAGSGHPGAQPYIQQAALPVTPLEREQDNKPQCLVDGKRDDRQRRSMGAAIGLGVVLACALTGWLLIGVDFPVIGYDDPQQLSISAVPDVESVPAASSELPAAEAPQLMPQVEPDSKAAPVPVEVSQPDPESAEEPQVQPPKEDVDRVVQQTPVVAGRSFNDGLKVGGQGPVMVELPADSFEMGSVGNSLNFDEGPRHQVNVPAFSISKHEVTFTEYDKFARATGRRLPYDESWGRGDHPVINVSWSDARAYARWLSTQSGKTYRLPSEAEWEYAARAGSVSNFWWHDSSDNLHANCFNCGSEWDRVRTTTVGSFEANAFGLHDVTGNVQEWTEDCYHGSYHDAPGDGSAWVSVGCTMRVVRGGAYTSPLDSLRSARRSQYDQDTRLDNLGFRVVREN
jgi:formylglycine-generating enzyme required for sulfatase activity/CRP-like cAMP-binding protein